MNGFLKTMAVTAVAAAALLAGTSAQADGERYVLVSHAPDSDSWWNTIKNGLALAGEQMGVEVEYRVNGGAKTGHLAAQNPASGGAPSDMARALLR